MKKLLLVLLLGGGAWYFFFGSTKVSEGHVRDFYQAQVQAMVDHDSEALCAMLADDFAGEGVTTAEGHRTRTSLDKASACNAYKDMFDQISKLGSLGGDLAALNYNHYVDDVEYGSDEKSATVTTHYTLDVGRFMHYKGDATETLIRRKGKVLLQYSKEKSSVTAG